MEVCEDGDTVSLMPDDGSSVHLQSMPVVIFLDQPTAEEEPLTLPIVQSNVVDDTSSNDVALLQGFSHNTDSDSIPLTWLGGAGVGSVGVDQLLYVTYVGDPPSSSQPGQPVLLQVASDPILLYDEKVDTVEDQQEQMPPPPPKRKAKEITRRNSLTIADDVSIETKLQVLEAMLPPLPQPPPRAPSKYKDLDDEIYKCDLCQSQFSRAAQYYGHLHTHSGERVWSCDVCQAQFNSQSKLRRHEKIHINYRPFKCNLCGLDFDRDSQLKYHERRIHLQERTHLCQFCSKGFFKRSDLKSHLNIHLGIRKNICETCGRQFSHRSNLTRHARIHSGVKPYVCQECGMRFIQLNALNTHKHLHHPTPVPSSDGTGFQCAHCLKNMRTLSLLRRHIKLVHPDEVSKPQTDSTTVSKIRHFHCTICGDSFQFLALLQQHELEVHAKSTSFYCRNCGQEFEYPTEMKFHSCVEATRITMNNLTKDLDETKNEENSAALELDSFLDHDLLEWPSEKQFVKENDEMIIYVRAEGQEEPTPVRIKCVTESSEFAQSNAFTFPMDTSENVENDEDNSNFSLLSVASDKSGEGEFQIEPIIDQTAEELVDSILQKDPIKITAQNIVQDSFKLEILEVEAKKKKEYHCDVCEKVFTKKSNFTQHEALHNLSLKKYKCQQCDGIYAWKSSLNKHMQTAHGDATKLPCSLCTKMLTSTTHLQEHLRRDHYKERSHVCTECPKSFYKKADLKVHLRTHSKERPYMCGTCGKSFVHLSHIIRHERIHSGIRPYTCDLCGRSFTQSTTLNFHKKRHLAPKNIRQKTLRVSPKSSTGKAIEVGTIYLKTPGACDIEIPVVL